MCISVAFVQRVKVLLLALLLRPWLCLGKYLARFKIGKQFNNAVESSMRIRRTNLCCRIVKGLLEQLEQWKPANIEKAQTILSGKVHIQYLSSIIA